MILGRPTSSKPFFSLELLSSSGDSFLASRKPKALLKILFRCKYLLEKRSPRQKPNPNPKIRVVENSSAITKLLVLSKKILRDFHTIRGMAVIQNETLARFKKINFKIYTGSPYWLFLSHISEKIWLF